MADEVTALSVMSANGFVLEGAAWTYAEDPTLRIEADLVDYLEDEALARTVRVLIRIHQDARSGWEIDRDVFELASRLTQEAVPLYTHARDRNPKGAAHLLYDFFREMAGLLKGIRVKSPGWAVPDTLATGAPEPPTEKGGESDTETEGGDGACPG